MASKELEGQVPGIMSRPYPDDREVGDRITLLWKTLEYPSSAAFARWLGESPSRISNVEGGTPLGKDLAIILVRKIPGLTTDWLWWGIEDGLSGKMINALAEARKRLETQAAPSARKTKTGRS